MNKRNFLKALRKREAAITTPNREERLATIDEIIDEIAWIPCDKRMPEEKDSIFKRLKGTDRWNNAMFEMSSNKVLVTIAFPDARARLTSIGHTIDGKWRTEMDTAFPNRQIIAWKPFPKPMEETE